MSICEMYSSEPQRPRRWWTEAEDQVLRLEAEMQLREGALKDWNRIAKRLPGRTNKDCRKRWSKVSNLVNKGMWTADEDRRLEAAVAIHGSKWTCVASMVGTRHADQCAKRWRHSLNPNLDRGEWTPEDDRALLRAVASNGRNWKSIGERRFPARSTTDIKNRYVILDRRRRHTIAGNPTRKLKSLSPPSTSNGLSFHLPRSHPSLESSSAPPGSINSSPTPSSAPFDLDGYSDPLIHDHPSCGSGEAFLAQLSTDPASLGLWLAGGPGGLWSSQPSSATSSPDDRLTPVPLSLSTPDYSLGVSHPSMAPDHQSSLAPTSAPNSMLLGGDALSSWPESLALDEVSSGSGMPLVSVCGPEFGDLQAMSAAPGLQMPAWMTAGVGGPRRVR